MTQQFIPAYILTDDVDEEGTQPSSSQLPRLPPQALPQLVELTKAVEVIAEEDLPDQGVEITKTIQLVPPGPPPLVKVSKKLAPPENQFKEVLSPSNEQDEANLQLDLENAPEAVPDPSESIPENSSTPSMPPLIKVAREVVQELTPEVGEKTESEPELVMPPLVKVERPIPPEPPKIVYVDKIVEKIVEKVVVKEVIKEVVVPSHPGSLFPVFYHNYLEGTTSMIRIFTDAQIHLAAEAGLYGFQWAVDRANAASGAEKGSAPFPGGYGSTSIGKDWMGHFLTSYLTALIASAKSSPELLGRAVHDTAVKGYLDHETMGPNQLRGLFASAGGNLVGSLDKDTIWLNNNRVAISPARSEVQRLFSTQMNDRAMRLGAEKSYPSAIPNFRDDQNNALPIPAGMTLCDTSVRPRAALGILYVVRVNTFEEMLPFHMDAIQPIE